jgi:hypothetical protein
MSLAFALLGLLAVAALLAGFAALGPVPSHAAPAGSEAADTLYVATDCSGLPTPCYGSVQEAVDAADDPGDVIQVAQGTYTGVQPRGGYVQSVQLPTKTVTIRGGYSPDFSQWDPDEYVTTLDAQGQGHVFTIFGAASPVIEGLRITGGDTGAGGGTWGGGVLAIGGSGPSLTVTLRYNEIISNSASTGSGGGGGLATFFCNVVLEGNEILYNEAAGVGGGARFEQSNLSLRDNVIRYNDSGASGGGLYLAMLSSGTMSNTVLADNDATVAGGGMVASGAYVRMRHTTVARNSSGDDSGIYVTVGWTGGLVSTVIMSNSIVVSHTVGLTVTAGPSWSDNHAILDGTLWDGTGILAGGDGDLVMVNAPHIGDPAFAADGYHLGPESAAIDVGEDAGVSADIDGQGRPAGSGYDLGADEFWYNAFLPVVNRGSSP